MTMAPSNGPDSQPTEDNAFPNSDVDWAMKSSKDSIASLNETTSQSAIITDPDRSSLIMREPTAFTMKLATEPPLKRLRFMLDDGKLLHGRSVSKADNWNSIISSLTNETQESVISKLGSEFEATDQEGDQSGYVTPTGMDQRIPESRNLVCPPPPRKRKASAFRRASSLPSASLLISPPDLHTFPECIRALFDK